MISLSEVNKLCSYLGEVDQPGSRRSCGRRDVSVSRADTPLAGMAERSLIYRRILTSQVLGLFLEITTNGAPLPQSQGASHGSDN